MLIVCGLSGAGKSTFGEIASSLGITVVEGSPTVAELFGVEKLDGEDIIAFCRRWFRERGGDIFAKENMRRMLAKGIDIEEVVFIGCRHAEEIKYFKGVDASAHSIAIYADESKRFERCLERNRPDTIRTFSQFVRRDMRELEMGLAELLAYTLDSFVLNNAGINEFQELTRKHLQSYFRKVAEEATDERA